MQANYSQNYMLSVILQIYFVVAYTMPDKYSQNYMLYCRFTLLWLTLCQINTPKIICCLLYCRLTLLWLLCQINTCTPKIMLSVILQVYSVMANTMPDKYSSRNRGKDIVFYCFLCSFCTVRSTFAVGCFLFSGFLLLHEF